MYFRSELKHNYLGPSERYFPSCIIPRYIILYSFVDINGRCSIFFQSCQLQIISGYKHKVATDEIGHRKRQTSAKLPTTLYRTLITRKSKNFNWSRFHELNLYLSVFQSYVIVRKGLVFVFHIKEKKMREVNKVEVRLKQGVQGNSIVLFLYDLS